jgi:hypothetical protein
MTTIPFSPDSHHNLVLFDVNERRYYTLDALAGLVWNLVQHPMTLREIRDAIVDRFDVEPETVERDVLNVLREMESNGLIEAANG